MAMQTFATSHKILRQARQMEFSRGKLLNPLVLLNLEREPSMFESAEIGHAIDKETYDAEVPALREALLDAQFELQ